ncbi:hypothetical protein QAD02_011109 [Eretmocerus hayati]|uniref:Uncharacterized protein n=1 Tax=Eretmocerus hayati TaxID=131215 RepID=A0ACC2NVU4_9HYME|nr:hypothetical protein QAD02_011109 [Eretmocerus hayati]
MPNSKFTKNDRKLSSSARTKSNILSSHVNQSSVFSGNHEKIPVSSKKIIGASFATEHQKGRIQEHATKNRGDSVNSSVKRADYRKDQSRVLQQDLRSKSMSKSDNFRGESKISNCNKSEYEAVYGSLDRKNLQQSKSVPSNFPPLHSPQSIVNVRHPLVTNSWSKQNDVNLNNGLNPTHVNGETHVEDDMNAISYHRLKPSGLSLPPFTSGPDSFSQATELTSTLLSDAGQFSQSHSLYLADQYQTYERRSYHSNGLNLSEYSENDISFSQYDGGAFVQSGHPFADVNNGQYQYQANGISQVHESQIFARNTISVANHSSTPSYATAVRSDLIPRPRLLSRFYK